MDNQDVTLLWPELFQIHVTEGLVVSGLEALLLRNIQEALAGEPDLEDPVTVAAWELLGVHGARTSRSVEWRVDRGLL